MRICLALRLAVIITDAAAIACAQPASIPAPNASVSGLVREAGTGNAIAGATVRLQAVAGGSMKEFTATSDAEGRYRLADVPPGTHRLVAFEPDRILGAAGRTVFLDGHDLDQVDITLAAQGTITGKVYDTSKAPVPGATVFLVSKEYYKGKIDSFIKYKATADAKGEYRLSVLAGRPWLLYAERSGEKRAAPSEVPSDPRKRLPLPRNTWYPNSPSMDGAAPLTVRPGETLQAIDIQMPDSPPLCVAGTMITPGGPAALTNFSIQSLEPTGGVSGGGAVFPLRPGGVTGRDGKFRICDLQRGSYWLYSAIPAGGGHESMFGESRIELGDEDVQDLKIALLPGLSVEGETVFDGPLPNDASLPEALIFFEPLRRLPPAGDARALKTGVPGTIRFSSVMNDEYGVRVLMPGSQRMPDGARLYVRDVTFGGRSILHGRVRPAEAVGGSGLRIVIGRDGSSITVMVTAKDGKPIADTGVVLFPGAGADYGLLADLLISGKADLQGRYTTGSIAPGKYYIAGTDETFDATPQSVDRLWRSRARFAEIELRPNEEEQVTIGVTAMSQ